MADEQSTSVPITLASLLFPALVLLLAAWAKSRTRRGRLPPSPWAIPVVGHLHHLRPPLHQAFNRLTARYGPIVHFRLGSTPCIVIGTADSARALLKSHDADVSDRPHTFAARQFAYHRAGFAMAPYGPFWRFMKRLCMSELLGPRTVDEMRPVRRDELSRLFAVFLENSRRSEPVDIGYEANKMTNNIIVRMLASTTPSVTDEARVVSKHVADLIGAFNMADHIGICRGLDLQGLNKRIKEVHRVFDDLMEVIIQEKEENRKKKKKSKAGAASGDQDEKHEVKDILDILLDVSTDENAEMKLGREDIKAFILDIITAGSESSAASIEWALTEMINHPAILKKVRDEIDGVVGTGRVVDEMDIPNLPYLQAVVKEILRFHPAAPLITRRVINDIDVLGYRISAGTDVFINAYSICRDPAYWDSPLEFRPERFVVAGGGEGNNNDEVMKKFDVTGKNYELIPFGSGRRLCPGITLALRAVTAAVAALVQCFEWEAVDDVQDMEEEAGMVTAKAKPLLLVPKPRFQPLPPIQA